jgi:hypothetical protein
MRYIEKAGPGLPGPAAIVLQLFDICCLQALIAFDDIEAHLISFGKVFKTITLNLGIVRKYIRPPILLGYETEPLRLIEPFYSSLCHSYFLLA